jgi:hypothetical protein
LNWKFYGELKASSPEREEIFPVLNKGLGVRIKDEEGHFSFGGF